VRKHGVVVCILIVLLLAACAPTFSPDQLFPSTVGDFLRVSGPAPDPDTGVDTAIYQGPPGTVMLRAREVGSDEVETALSQPPFGATSVGLDPGLGTREGIFFDYGGQFHAAWGNGDWVFIITADSDAARRNFLNGYGF